jgi:hypothetical protein
MPMFQITVTAKIFYSLRCNIIGGYSYTLVSLYCILSLKNSCCRSFETARLLPKVTRVLNSSPITEVYRGS